MNIGEEELRVKMPHHPPRASSSAATTTILRSRAARRPGVRAKCRRSAQSARWPLETLAFDDVFDDDDEPHGPDGDDSGRAPTDGQGGDEMMGRERRCDGGARRGGGRCPFRGRRAGSLATGAQTRVLVDILVVQTAYRRHGIGTHLMEAVEEWARAKEASALLIDTYIESGLSVPFYERRMGYKRRAVRFRKAFE